jgi:sulfite reductase alpha subunit-like flavoprotein
MRPNILPLFSTQTGTSQRYAEDLFQQLQRRRRRNLNGLDDDNNDSLMMVKISYPKPWDDPTLLFSVNDDISSNTIIIFIISTTGDGDIPTHSLVAWKNLLNAKLSSNRLANIRYALFGLGDSSYEKFNAAGRKLSARLGQLGAISICDSSAGDDLHTPFVVFDKWMRLKLFPVLVQLFPSQFTVTPTITTTPTPTTNNINLLTIQPIYQLSVLSNTRLTPSDWFQETHHIEFESSPNNNMMEKIPEWYPGDSIYIYPCNPISQAKSLCERILANNLTQTSLSKQEIESLFIHHLDILNIPSRLFFEIASLFCTNIEERDKMRELAGFPPAATSSEEPEQEEQLFNTAAESYYLYCIQERRTFLEVLQDFPSCQLPIEHALQLIPQLRARPYSISSNYITHHGQIHLTVAVASYLTPWKRLVKGTCSSYLAQLQHSDQVRVQGMDNTGPLSRAFRPFLTVPTTASPLLTTPPPPPLIILIATGTGIAPMRSFITSSTNNPNNNNNNILLYFGCRCPEKDEYYKNEFNVKIKIAYSRPPPTTLTVKKSYIHSLLVQDSNLLYNECFVKNNAYVLICGSAKRMPLDVKETFIQFAQRLGNIGRDDAVKHIRKMEKEGKWVVEGF